MKIALVRRAYSPTGGAEKFLLRLADGLMTAGNGVVLFASPEWPAAARPSGAEFHPVPGRTPMAFARALEALGPRRFCDRVFSLERVLDCDLYRAGDGVHAAWLRRREAVEPKWRKIFRFLNFKHGEILRLERRLYGENGARAIVVNSRMVRDEILALHGGEPSRIHIVPNGLPPENFTVADPARRAQARASFGFAPEQTVVAFVGSGWRRKGLPWAMQAIAQLNRPDLLLAVAGRPERGVRLRGAQVRNLGSDVHVADLLAAADLFLLPTLYDPFSNATLEALGAGLPVITTAANGCADVMIPGHDGEVVPHGADVSVLADALNAWLDPVRRSAARPLISARASEWTTARNVADTLKILASP